VGNYVLYASPDAGGIRPTAYSTDMTRNPSTYDSVKTAAVPHGVGYVWATMLYEVYWNLVDAYGFNPNVYDAWSTGGNNLAIQLVVDGMKLQPCSPGFVDARDAILLADQALTGGKNQCHIWKGFAKRGLGLSASDGSSASVTDGVQAFDLPAACTAQIAVTPSAPIGYAKAGKKATRILTIANGAAAGGEPLPFTVTEAASTCASPGDLPWASLSATSGSVAGGSNTKLTLTFDAAGLTPATRSSGRLCFTNPGSGALLADVPIALAVQYPFVGFFGVANPPSVNTVAGGSDQALVFGLGGDYGTSIFQASSPGSQEIDCATKDPLATAKPTAAGAPLAFDAGTQRYTYSWRTESGWAGTCRQFLLRLNDGTKYRAYFRFN
jgi:hypothetical protein